MGHEFFRAKAAIPWFSTGLGDIRHSQRSLHSAAAIAGYCGECLQRRINTGAFLLQLLNNACEFIHAGSCSKDANCARWRSRSARYRAINIEIATWNRSFEEMGIPPQLILRHEHPQVVQVTSCCRFLPVAPKEP